MPDLSRASFEALLARFSGDANSRHIGQTGWECAAQISGAIYVPGRSLSHADPGLASASPGACGELCNSTAGCNYYMWGHSLPDFSNGSVRQLRHHLGSISRAFPAPIHPALPVCRGLLIARADWELIGWDGAWNPVVCPIRG